MVYKNSEDVDMELVPESFLDTDKTKEAVKRVHVSKASPRSLHGDAQAAVNVSTVDKPRQQTDLAGLADIFQRVDPVFYFTLLLLSALLVIGFYQLSAWSNRVIATHLSEIETGNKLISEQMALSKTDSSLQQPQSIFLTGQESVVREQTPPELQSASGLESTLTSVSPVESEASQSTEINRLRQMLSEKSQLAELLALENHELRLSLEFGQKAVTESVTVPAKAIETVITDTAGKVIPGPADELSTVLDTASVSEIQQPAPVSVSDLLARADKAFSTQEYVTAANLYGLAVQQNPRSREANLGVASTAVLSGNLELAIDRYRHLLSLYPHDQRVFGAMLDLATTDNMVETELLGHVSRLSTDQALFYSMLGNYFGRKNRWKEANSTFVDARQSSVPPVAADILFNLAVSFEHLGSASKAVEYYRQALAANNGASFDQTSVQSRLNELTR